MDSDKRSLEPDLSVVCIATGRYLFFWQNLVKSSAENFEDFKKIHWVLLTDKAGEISSEILNLLGSNLSIRFIPHSDWPMPTLLRYQYISAISKIITSPKVLYMDADMKVISKISRATLDSFFSSSEMSLVAHPGYFRSGGNSFIKSPKIFISDLKLKIRYGGVGSWETKRRSQAFVERSKRKIYLCGGIWGGPNQLFVSFVELLRERVQKDLDINYIAKFHDESHLNWFAANFPVKVLNPSWCYEKSYANLQGLPQIIEAVDKNSSELWVR